ncbi:cation diffusion facilitator family transporter [Anaeromyxobacter terrae]|uniref:cation diffusion facilitator family transporter n=1 Tax=Anaeromyxobacter terrae TaxID=2925406 RepID=UPI001F5A9069|nr:cation transporter [Anaeromyxobacter sp. SG22]
MNEVTARNRSESVGYALRLEYLTVGWNVVEGVIAVTAAVLAGSVALLGFGIDSFVESASGAVLIWRLVAERRGMDEEEVERLDGRAHRLVGASLFLLGAYIAVEAGTALWNREAPRPSTVGIVLTAVSIVTMQWLARAKRRAARRLGSRALEADAFQTTACFWLSIITLAGIGLNAAFAWWWADPVAALAMTWFIVKEAREAWRGEDCDCSGKVEDVSPAGLGAGEGRGCTDGCERKQVE